MKDLDNNIRKLEILRISKRIEQVDYFFKLAMAICLDALVILWVYLELKVNL
jgi:hypothetical protein